MDKMYIIRLLKFSGILVVFHSYGQASATSFSWSEMGGICYGLSSVAKNYSSSVDSCSQENSDIVEVCTNETHTYLISVMDPLKQYWVGLEQRNTTNFYWSDGSEAGSEMWLPTEPNHSGSRVRYTVSVGNITSPHHVFADNPESSTYNFICMKELQSNGEGDLHGSALSSANVNQHTKITNFKRRSKLHCVTLCGSYRNCNMIGFNSLDKDCALFRWTGTITSIFKTNYRYFDVRRKCN